MFMIAATALCFWACATGMDSPPVTASTPVCSASHLRTRSAWQHIDIISNKPFVSVRINNSRPLNFVLDAGSPWTFIDTRLASELGLTQLPDSVLVGGFAPALGPRVCVHVLGVTLDDMRLGAVELDHISAVEGVRVDGLVGKELFEKFVVLIDYPGSRARAYPASYDYHGKGEVLPLKIQDLAFCNVQLLAPDGHYAPGTFIFDTGVRLAVALNRPYVERYGWLHGTPVVRGLTVGVGMGGETRGDLFVLPDVMVGNLHVPDVVAVASLDSVVLDPNSNEAGILGGDFMRRFRVWIDYPHRRAILEPTYELGHRFDYDRSGMFLLAEGDGYRTLRVRRVAPGSPADAAGVMPGDRLVSINGRLIGRLGLEATRRLLRDDHRRCRVVVERDGKRLRLEFVTMDLTESKAASTR